MPYRSVLLSAALLLAAPCYAQDEPQGTVDFEGGKFAITENDDAEKILTYDGQEIARNYVMAFDRTETVAGVPVALFLSGSGGNACGPATVIAWRPEGSAIKTTTVGDDCGAPSPAVSDNAIYFVPYLLPGASEDVRIWTPDGGVKVAGKLSFTPQQGTGWADFDESKLDSILSAFDNAAVYEAANKLLGADVESFATSLSISSEPTVLPSGVAYGSGCVPHACTVSDGFLAVDPTAQALYMAQQQESGPPKAWPPVETWPTELRDAMNAAIGK